MAARLKKIIINQVQSKNRARPMAARLKNKPGAEQELRSAHGRAVKKKINQVQSKNRARPMAARLIKHLPAVIGRPISDILSNKELLNPLKNELLTKQACRDELVVYSLFFFSNNLYFALLICIEHFFTNIELYTLYMNICIYIMCSLSTYWKRIPVSPIKKLWAVHAVDSVNDVPLLLKSVKVLGFLIGERIIYMRRI